MGRHNDWPPPGGAGHLSHTHPHLLSTSVGEAVQGLLWSLIQLLLLLPGAVQARGSEGRGRPFHRSEKGVYDRRSGGTLIIVTLRTHEEKFGRR